MPTVAHYVQEHRDRNLPLLYNACVAKSISMKEMIAHPKGREAQASEWSRLRKVTTWDESAVREWADVAAEAKKKNQKHHVGRIFEVSVIKGSELPDGHPGK